MGGAGSVDRAGPLLDALEPCVGQLIERCEPSAPRGERRALARWFRTQEVDASTSCVLNQRANARRSRVTHLQDRIADAPACACIDCGRDAI